MISDPSRRSVAPDHFSPNAKSFTELDTPNFTTGFAVIHEEHVWKAKQKPLHTVDSSDSP
jgi:hypothetical protein